MFSCIPTKTKTKRGCKIYITPHRIDIRADREANRGFFLKLSSLPYNRLASRLGYFSVVFQSTGKLPFVITSIDYPSLKVFPNTNYFCNSDDDIMF